VARHFFKAVQDDIAKLADNPQLGVPRTLPNKRLTGLRFWITHGFDNYMIFYQPMRDGIRVVRIIHSKQDYMRVLMR
jgi:plasmid stabilization system protein ParE